MSIKEQREKIKHQRIIKYFIEATQEIIKKDGIENITIRKVAELAGYTSATLYNYFDNLKHVIFLANMRYLESYNNNLQACVENCENSIEIYMAVCKCFSIQAYNKPEIFGLLFFSHGNEKFEKYTTQYYELYPEQHTLTHPGFLDKMFRINNLASRSFTMLENCIQNGFIERENAKDFNDICLRFNKTILQDVKDGELEKEKALELTLKYYYQLFSFFLKPEYKHLLENYYPKLV